DTIVRSIRLGVRIRRVVLCRVRGHDSSGRQRLHLRLRDTGGVDRLDYRLGPDARVRHGRQHRIFGLVETLYRIAEYLPYQDAALAGLRSLDSAEDRCEY